MPFRHAGSDDILQWHVCTLKSGTTQWVMTDEPVSADFAKATYPDDEGGYWLKGVAWSLSGDYDSPMGAAFIRDGDTNGDRARTLARDTAAVAGWYAGYLVYPDRQTVDHILTQARAVVSLPEDIDRAFTTSYTPGLVPMGDLPPEPGVIWWADSDDRHDPRGYAMAYAGLVSAVVGEDERRLAMGLPLDDPFAGPSGK